MSAGKYTDFEIFRRLIAISAPFWPHLFGIFCLELLAVPFVLLLPIPVKIAVDSVVGNAPIPAFLQRGLPALASGSKITLLWTVVFLQVLFVFLAHFIYMSGYVLQTFTGEKLKLRFRQGLFRHVQRLSFSFHDTRGTADSIFRIQYDAPAIQHVTIQGLIPLVSACMKLVGIIWVISRINLQLAVVALSIVPVLYALASFYNKSMRPRYTRIQKMESRVLGIIQEVMTSFRVVKAFSREESEHTRFSVQSSDTLQKKIRLSFAEGVFGILVNLTTSCGTAAVIFFGVSRVLSGAITLGELLMVLTYLTQIYSPLQSISQQIISLQGSFVSAHRALELLDEIPDVLEKPHAKHLTRARGLIQYRDVQFSYGHNAPVLKNISFSVEPGTNVGIRGKTGAGKSTLISLLPRFYDVTAGQVLIDGIDVRDYRLQDLRNQFSIVLQDSVLFSTTIAENIMYAKADATRGEVIAAAKAANAHEFIMRLPNGYEAMAGEHGMKLSGGERQRIALARAFLKNAPILLLDEPTSAVDTKTEELIMEAMERLMRERTTFMIAHRLATLEQCQMLLEIEDGKLKILRDKPSAFMHEAIGGTP